MNDLAAKYDVAGPRYNSYPTVPYWDSTPLSAEWLEHLNAAFERHAAEGAALYVHIPFCRSLCTFCGCNTRITRSHDTVAPYVAALLAELDLYRSALGRAQIRLGELYLGGGTPTFLSAEELERLLEQLFARVQLLPSAALAVEVDPRVTTAEQLSVLSRYGFRRLSMGVQDFDARVQDIVNRVQSETQVREVTQAARTLGFDSVNFDLIYGLPLQTGDSIELTMDALERLMPDRVAFYRYAHVPWIKPGQRRFTDADLPEGEECRALGALGRARLERAGYQQLGLDHFVRETEALWQAQRAGHLHRNFMGYTSACVLPLIGLGVSALSDAGSAQVQNEKELQRYQQRVSAGEWAVQRGHVLDAEDRILRRHILRLLTRQATDWRDSADQTAHLQSALQLLREPASDGLIELSDQACRVSARGRAYLRNICMAFDARLARRMPERQVYRRSA